MWAEPLWNAASVLLGYSIFCAVIWRRARRGSEPPPLSAPGRDGVLVSYASQGGTAERIARQSAHRLHGKVQVAVLPMNQVNADTLRQYKQALFVVSTYGEGEPPDNALLFARRYLRRRVQRGWSGIRYGVLALGDRQYAHFCGFGQSVHEGLVRNGARPLFEPVLVDREDPQALDQWHGLLNGLGVGNVNADAEPACAANDESAFSAWRLQSRQQLNAGSSAAPVYLLQLVPADDGDSLPPWEAGDIAQIRVLDQQKNQQVRDYSIASLPSDGALELVVRQHQFDDGRLGLGSGYLTSELPVGGELPVSIRRNTGFHPPPINQPMILIGNGTGIAGLRAHLKAREQESEQSRNWLLFGERNARSDSLFHDELINWQRRGHLQRLDRTFSRDQKELRYVQHALGEAAASLRTWVRQGAHIYVCGSRNGMAEEVDLALRLHLGERCVDKLLAQQRYRRDVY